jgi:predicted DNA binding protein
MAWRRCGLCNHTLLQERKTAAKLFRSEAGRKLEAAVAQEGKALAEEADAQEQQQQQDGQGKGALTDEQKRIAAVGGLEWMADSRGCWLLTWSMRHHRR